MHTFIHWTHLSVRLHVRPRLGCWEHRKGQALQHSQAGSPSRQVTDCDTSEHSDFTWGCCSDVKTKLPRGRGACHESGEGRARRGAGRGGDLRAAGRAAGKQAGAARDSAHPHRQGTMLQGGLSSGGEGSAGSPHSWANGRIESRGVVWSHSHVHAVFLGGRPARQSGCTEEAVAPRGSRHSSAVLMCDRHTLLRGFAVSSGSVTIPCTCARSLGSGDLREVG